MISAPVPLIPLVMRFSKGADVGVPTIERVLDALRSRPLRAQILHGIFEGPEALRGKQSLYLRPLGSDYEWEARACDLIPLPEEETISTTTAESQ